MKKTNTRRQLGLMSAVLAGCFLLSSCAFGTGGVESGIKKAVTSYLDVIQDGTFADDEYASEFADDAAFSDLEFADEAVKEIMEKGFRKIEYTIDAVSGSLKNNEGSCDLTITAVNVEKVIAGFEDDSFDADMLMDAIKDKKVPMKDYEITLDMTYDKADKVWLVADSTPLVKILGDPYAAITFGPAAGEPAAVIDTFMTALAAGDSDTIDQISPYYDSSNFFDEDQNVMGMITKFYGLITYEVNGDPTITQDMADVDVTLTMPDIVTIIDEVSNDADFMSTIYKPYILASIQGDDTTAADEESKIAFSEKVEERLNSSDVPMISVDSVFQLELNPDTQLWDVYEVPSELYDINADPTISDEMSLQAAAMALDSLYQEGSIDQATYDQYMAELSGTDTTDTSNTGTPESDIIFGGWYDYNSESYVTEYDSSSTYTIEYDIGFYNEWPGLVVYYDYYNQNGTVLIKSSSETMQSGQYDLYVPLEFDDGSLLPADTYMVVLYLEDGTVLAQDSVTIL